VENKTSLNYPKNRTELKRETGISKRKRLIANVLVLGALVAVGMLLAHLLCLSCGIANSPEDRLLRFVIYSAVGSLAGKCFTLFLSR